MSNEDSGSNGRLSFGDKTNKSFLPTEEQLAESEAVQTVNGTDGEVAAEQPVEAHTEEVAPEPVDAPAEAPSTAEQTAEAATPVVDGSQADLVQEVGQRLSEEVAKVEVRPETVLENAPAAVAEAVAEHADPEVKFDVGSDGETIESLRAKQDAINAENQRINEAIANKKKSDKIPVIAQIKQVAETYGVTINDLIEAFGGVPKAPRKSSPAKMKYRDPATGKEWSGRGKAPLWIKDKNKQDFLITV